MTREKVLEIIEEADAVWVDHFLDAAINRKRELYPDWEISYIAMGRKAGKETWEQVWRLLSES